MGEHKPLALKNRLIETRNKLNRKLVYVQPNTGLGKIITAEPVISGCHQAAPAVRS